MHKQKRRHFHAKMTVHWRSTYGAGHIPLCDIFHYDFLGCHWLYSERLSPFKIKPIGLYFDTSSQFIFVWFFSANVLQSWLVPPDMRKDSDSFTSFRAFGRFFYCFLFGEEKLIIFTYGVPLVMENCPKIINLFLNIPLIMLSTKLKLKLELRFENYND